MPPLKFCNDVGFAFAVHGEETARVVKQRQNLVESRQVQEQVWGWLGISRDRVIMKRANSRKCSPLPLLPNLAN